MNNLALKLTQVEKHYSSFSLRKIDLCLPRGSIMSLIGPNGAGKTTTLNLITGFLRQDSGEICVLGQHTPSRHHLIKEHIGYVSQEMRLYQNATIAWHMNYVASIFIKWDNKYASKLLTHFKLDPNSKPKELSQGQHTKALLLLALARRPELLVLDEPTAGLDPNFRQETLGEFISAIQDEERSVIFSTHNTHDVEQISDLISFIDDGKIVAKGDKESFISQWKRIQIECDNNDYLSEIPNVINTDRSGNLLTITIDCYTESILENIKSKSVKLIGVQSMSLEEIFIATVGASNKDAYQ